MPFTGEWFNQNRPPILKAGGAVTADVETADLAASAVTAAKIADGVVSSEKATSALRQRSVLLFMDATTSTEAGGVAGVATTAIVAWRPRSNVNVLAVAYVSLGPHQNATCDNFTLYGNAGTCITDIALKGASTALARGTRVASGALTQVALAAGTDLLIKGFLSTCSVSGRAGFIVDYESSG